jgi:flavin-binding protein dodecin
MKNKKKKKDDSAAASGSGAATVARVTEIIASSPISFEDAVSVGVARACKTLKNVTGAWVQDQKVDVVDGKISCYRVNLKVTFVLND